MKSLKCPQCDETLIIEKTPKTITFKGVDVFLELEAYRCPSCGLEAGTVQSAGRIQRTIADSYRTSQNLLTGDEIRALRKARSLSQQQLADLMQVGIASIKRWETGLVQTRSMDQALRKLLQEGHNSDGHSGNRQFSIERVKLVAKQFESFLERRLLKKGDKFLFLAKYIWYADMLSFKYLNRSMTGSSYAALPYGPQLNNYTDLVDEIKNADEGLAEPLSQDELQIIKHIVKRFPSDRSVYDAAHKELVWKEKKIGAPLPYADAWRITAIGEIFCS